MAQIRHSLDSATIRGCHEAARAAQRSNRRRSGK